MYSNLTDMLEAPISECAIVTVVTTVRDYICRIDNVCTDSAGNAFALNVYSEEVGMVLIPWHAVTAIENYTPGPNLA
jgi:hypothetical protein